MNNLLGATLALAMAGFGALPLSAAASANLVTNGGFDLGTSGWTLADTDGGVFSSTEGNPGGALILNNSPGPVPRASQEILGLLLGTQYDIAFDAKSHYNCCNSASTPGSSVRIDGHKFDFFILNGQPWTSYSFSFVYAGGSNILTLASQDNGTDADGEFDNLSLTSVAPVPVPGSAALLLSGLAMAGVARRKRAAA